jgi:hypothetical protein
VVRGGLWFVAGCGSWRVVVSRCVASVCSGGQTCRVTRLVLRLLTSPAQAFAEGDVVAEVTCLLPVPLAVFAEAEKVVMNV